MHPILQQVIDFSFEFLTCGDTTLSTHDSRMALASTVGSDIIALARKCLNSPINTITTVNGTNTQSRIWGSRAKVAMIAKSGSQVPNFWPYSGRLDSGITKPNAQMLRMRPVAGNRNVVDVQCPQVALSCGTE